MLTHSRGKLLNQTCTYTDTQLHTQHYVTYIYCECVQWVYVCVICVYMFTPSHGMRICESRQTTCLMSAKTSSALLIHSSACNNGTVLKWNTTFNTFKWHATHLTDNTWYSKYKIPAVGNSLIQYIRTKNYCFFYLKTFVLSSRLAELWDIRTGVGS